MRWLSDDRGAATVIVAVVLIAMVAMVAFAVDAAAIYAERRELQNGADAAVLAIAEDCGHGIVPCNSATAAATANTYADRNATDGAAGIHTLQLNTGQQTVTVVTQTDDGSGATVLAPFFAQVIGHEGSTVGAEATAAWGYPRSLATLPLIFSDCEWQKYGLPAGPLQPGPDYTGTPSLLYFHADAEPCHSSPSGQDMPGGFGWLAASGPCEATVEVGNWVGIDPGASPATSCSPGYLNSLVGEIVLLPYYDAITGTGNNAEYHVVGFGALYVTGFNFGGQYKAPSPATMPCNGADRCIEGYFTTATATVGEFGGENRGVVLVKLTG